jgi:hypothetical protein
VSGQLHAPAALPLGKETMVPIGQESGWTPEPVRMISKNFSPYRDSKSDLSAVQPVASRYADYATVAHKENGMNVFNLQGTVSTEHIINKHRQIHYLCLLQISRVQLQWFDSCQHPTQNQRKLFQRATILLIHILQIDMNESHIFHLLLSWVMYNSPDQTVHYHILSVYIGRFVSNLGLVQIQRQLTRFRM